MPSGSRLALVFLLVALVLGPVAAHPTGGPAADGHAGQPVEAGSAVESLDGPTRATAPAVADGDIRLSNTTMRVRLTPDGDARWQVSASINLTDQADREAFRETAAAFERGEVTTGWLTAFRQARAEASRATGRQMRIHSPDRSWSIDESDGGNATGRFVLTFTWTDFARVTDDGQRLEVSDAFATTQETWLALEPGQTLVIEPPNDFTPVTGSGDLRDRSFHWEGPESFESEPPSAIFTGGGGFSTLMVASLVVAGLALLLVLVYLLASRREVLTDRGGDDDLDAAGAAAESAADEPSAGGSDGSIDDASGEDDEVDVTLLSDEERVERLLDRNGGRMKQASIVKETGWSNAKVSQLLSAMEETDRIDKLRIGRENLISFPDEDVADVEE